MDFVWHWTGLGVSFTSWIVSPFWDIQEDPRLNGDGVVLDILLARARGEMDADGLYPGTPTLEKQLDLLYS